MTPERTGRAGSRSHEGGDWRRPRDEQASLSRYLEILRERSGLILVTVAATLALALVYLAVADKQYRAEADLLVTPVQGDEVFNGLPVLRESNDPTRDVETAAQLVTTRDVAREAAQSLPGNPDEDELLGKVEAAPVAQSNIVAITATADSPALSAQIANAFGRAIVADRTSQFHEALDRSIERLQARVDQLPSGVAEDTGGLRDQLARLEALRAGGDPTIGLETRATPPDSAYSPRPFLTLVAALIAGLVLGIGGAFALHAVDPRLRREEQLRNLYQVPILARIPRDTRAQTSTQGHRRLLVGPHTKRRRALGPRELSRATIEAYRTLRTMLAASRPVTAGGRSILITGPSPSEGKTTTAINLAASLALAGNKVILIEADFRRPTVGEALVARPVVGIGQVLLGRQTLEQALVPATAVGDNLKLLLVGHADEWLPELLSLPAASSLLADAGALADYVIIDSPPLTEVIDALPLARQVDDVIIVVRLGTSKLTQLARLGDLLAQNGIEPSGFVLVGSGDSQKETYYLSAQRERMGIYAQQVEEMEAELKEPRAGSGSVRP
jgi:polysaccharide biosynthesis transport protein